MSRQVSWRALLIAAGCLLPAGPARAADGPAGKQVDVAWRAGDGLPPAPPGPVERGRTGPLVDVAWLAAHRGDRQLLILDASSAKAYAAGHIPGAINVDLYAYGIAELAPAELERRYRSWGVAPGRTIVLYDQGGSNAATRTFYDLYYHGFPGRNLAILDGGLAKWREQGQPVTGEATPLPGDGSFKVGAADESVRARLPEVLAATGDPRHNAIVEALGGEWHFGAVGPFDRAGHVPNAILLPADDFYRPDRTFKSAAEIRRMLAYVGIQPGQQVYTICGGGVNASVPFFALRFLADYPRVKLYPESEMGWLADERGLPYWTYDAPYLLRESRWLNWSGGQIIRRYVGTRVSIVDVRPAAAYRQGHLPFALNVPADVFRAGLADPGKLAATLGAAGVDPTLEAVIVSGAGVTKEAALAFVLLEELGQARASIFTDSLARWSRLGLALDQQPTAVGARKGPQDVTIPPAVYSDEARNGVLVTTAAATAHPAAATDPFPTVFIASGAQVPAAAPAGKVVHVAYSDLLNADGTPRAAKDIWKILSAAGVPRFARLICFSEDPGEAAVNYFLLRLMGYPDVKVLTTTPPTAADGATE